MRPFPRGTGRALGIGAAGRWRRDERRAARRGMVAVLWLVSGDPGLVAAAVSPVEAGIEVPADIAVFAEATGGREVLVTTVMQRPAGRCDVLYGRITESEARTLNAFIARLVS